jgi:hypothetical protein
MRVLRQCIFSFAQISLHKFFPTYLMTYTTVVGGGMVNEESKTSVLISVSISYVNMSNVRKIKHL